MGNYNSKVKAIINDWNRDPFQNNAKLAIRHGVDPAVTKGLYPPGQFKPPLSTILQAQVYYAMRTFPEADAKQIADMLAVDAGVYYTVVKAFGGKKGQNKVTRDMLAAIQGVDPLALQHVPERVITPVVTSDQADEIIDREIHDRMYPVDTGKNEGKARYDLVDPLLIDTLAEVLTVGADKHGARNWHEKPKPWGSYFAATMRHLWAWWKGERQDADTGLSHLGHAVASLMFLMVYENERIGEDDRPGRGSHDKSEG